MRYIDVLETYRKDYKIPVTTWIEGVMSTHTYYRYLKGNTDLKVSQALTLLKKTDIDPEALFSYLSDLQEPHKHDLERFLQHRVNGHLPRLKQAYEILMQSYVMHTSYIYQKPYKKYERENLQTLYKQAIDLVVLTYQFESGFIDSNTFYTYLEYTKDPYVLYKKEHLYSLLITSNVYQYEKPLLPLDEMFRLATKESFFKSYTWDLMFLVCKQLTHDPHIKTYEHVREAYIIYIDYMLKKLQGTLDIGFIKSIYYHGFLRFTLDYDEDKRNNYLLRYLMTSQFNDSKDIQQEHIQVIESIVGPIDSILTPYLEALKIKGAS